MNMASFKQVLIICKDGKTQHIFMTKQQIADLIDYLDKAPSVPLHTQSESYEVTDLIIRGDYKKPMLLVIDDLDNKAGRTE
ncbi:hypothetical protein ACFP7A_09000 [Sporolactobacillus kofuensis]|uniref:Uncharacterized protein n=1 Tax=Sporolactobacillus kofuensis TaxID=269672 RepID=A0ABW1WHZ0_9BACL|nr:hypothetical protein [Sporolactobacillus kofuensis]MCO7176139.1 hypothetical protein [Sporolactobacillus kofuensis]